MLKKINPQEAHKILQQENGALLIDVRSSIEYSFVGHPLNAINIPIKEPPNWNVQLRFIEQVRESLVTDVVDNNQSGDVPLLVLCRSGQRSALAGEILIEGGFTNVFNVLNGFEGDKNKNGHRNTINGWRFQGLPWEQS
ncbi:rhodanese-like domain-containing protein [Gammaproteobacteria bacterium]|jgi:rhodanese-related sulfurtransferase|nr:rhodanese-like domain-containing protein [Gammaproteobacteria bacterium]|tara:strand:- start:5 stop:421 length:417 start_codon:yes stop_codon:yes gene_type:complete